MVLKIATSQHRYVTYSDSAPTSGTWKEADIVFNNNADSGRNVGWVCVEAGSPGVWKEWGVVRAEAVGGAIVNSITALKTLLPVDKQVVEVLGYYAANDGGGGTFVWDATSSAVDNGGTIIASSTSANGRWIRNYDGSAVNIRWFGARGQSASEDIKAINGALKIGDAFVPAGEFLLTAYFISYRSELNSTLDTFAGVVIPQGKRLFGSGQNSILKLDPISTYPMNGGARTAIVLRSHSVLEDLTIDGNYNAVQTHAQNLGLTSISVSFVRSYPFGESFIRCSNLIVKDIYCSPSEEGFGISATGAKDVIFENIEGYNVSGTPIHIDGDYIYPSNRAERVIVRNCRLYNNTWQGISLYGAKDIFVSDLIAYNNTLHGFNVEWAENITFNTCISYNNGRAGIGTYGKIDNFILDNCSGFGNGYNDAFGAEIKILAGSWYRANPATGIIPRGIAKTVIINGGSFTPAINKFHIYSNELLDATETNSVLSKLQLNIAGTENWRILQNYSGLASGVKSFSGIEFTNLKLSTVDGIKPLDSWTKTAAAAISAYTGGGAKSLNPKNITSTAQFANIKTLVSNNKKYLIRIRYNLSSSASTWNLILLKEGTTTNGGILSLAKTSQDLNTWFEAEAIFAATDGNWNVQMQCDSTGSNLLIVDYLQIIEIINPQTNLDSFVNKIINAFLLEKLGIGTSTPGPKFQVSGGVAIASGTAAAADPGAGNLSVAGRTATGGLKVGARIVTANTTITTAGCLLYIDASVNPIDLTLPTAIGNFGTLFVLIRTDNSTNVVRVLTSVAGQTINNSSTSFAITGGASFNFSSNDVNWFVF